jgi:hypothetical protein
MDTALLSRQDCIEDCLRCYRVCFEMAMTHCLEHGGRHVEPGHFRIMMACAEICRLRAPGRHGGLRPPVPPLREELQRNVP